MIVESPIFITGHHRSGKTLVRWLLDAHPAIAVSQRTQMWPKFYRRFGPLTDDENLDRCLEAMKSRKQISRMGPDWEALRASFLEGPPTYARLFALAHEQYGAKRAAERWGDQSSGLERYAERIFEAFPNAKVIHMVRDPIDAFAAFAGKSTRRLSGAGFFAAGWSMSARTAAENMQRHPEGYLVVRYEDLVADPAATASFMLDFVGEEFDDELLSLPNAERYAEQREGSERGWAITNEFVGMGDSVGPCEARSIAVATRKELEAYGYDPRVPLGRAGVASCWITSLWHLATRALEDLRLARKENPPAETDSYSAAMRAWHRLTDSDGFRQSVKRGRLSPVLKSGIYRAADIKRRQILVRIAGNQPDFDGVRTFTLFVGHNKSGTSLLGSLLDAHRSIVMSDEADALKYIEAGVSREELFRILMRASRSEARKGRVTARRLGGYSYAVAGQWQGRADAPVVVGDSMSGTTTRKLADRLSLVEQTEKLVHPAALRAIQVVRNPFDPISLMAIRGNRSVANSVDHYFRACERLVAIQETLGKERLLLVHYEDLVDDPETELKEVARYLGFEADAEYLQACASLVEPAFEHSRSRIEWSDRWIEEVEARIGEYAFLAGYAFGSTARNELSS